MNDQDYQSLKELSGSEGWKILCMELDDRISSIQVILETPTDDDMFGVISDKSAIEKLNLLNYKKAELKYLRILKELPESLIATRIKK